MKKAIITGASGLVGRSLAKYLSSVNIDVLCLGRQDWDSEHVRDYFGEGIVYMQLEMENISLLSDKISDLNWEVGNDCVFYNFAWGGIKGLTDGSFEDQLRNAISSSLAIKVAKEIGCSNLSIPELLKKPMHNHILPVAHSILRLKRTTQLLNWRAETCVPWSLT